MRYNASRHNAVVTLLLSLLLYVTLVKSQTNDLQDPSLINFVLEPSTSATFHLPSDALQKPEGPANLPNTYRVTLNICNAPESTTADDLDALKDLPILFAFGSEDTSDTTKASSATADLGYASLTVMHNSNRDNGLWVVVNAPASNSTSSNAAWSFELGISIGEPMQILDRYPLFQLGDSDNTSAVLTSPTYFPSLDGEPAYQLFVLPTSASPLAEQLSHSACYVRQLADLLPSTSINQTLTQRGVITIGPAEGAIGRQREEYTDGGQRAQYVLNGLEVGTNYTVWGMQSNGQETSAGIQGTTLYRPQYFTTKTTTNCRLVTDFPACPNVAYSVPSPPQLPTNVLLDVYNATIQPHLFNFNRTLSIFPCGIEDQGLYSSVRTCDDCMRAYTTWLCSVLVPRCTDIPSNMTETAQLNSTIPSRAGWNDELIPEYIHTTLIRTNPAISRTPQFSPVALQANTALAAFDPTTPFPYAEVPPCLGVCQSVHASCPPMMDWNCPLESVSAAASYGEMADLGDAELQGGNEGIVSEQTGRSTDRFGNVYCNALGVDVLIAARSG